MTLACERLVMPLAFGLTVLPEEPYQRPIEVRALVEHARVARQPACMPPGLDRRATAFA